MTLVTLLAACSDVTAPESAVARWELVTVDAHALPATMYDEEGYSLAVTSGEITLAADSTYANDVTVTETVDGYVSIYVDRATGRWIEETPGAITLTPTGEQSISATWSGTSLTVTASEFTMVYSRTP